MTNILNRSALDIVEKAFRTCRITDPQIPLESQYREDGFQAINDLVKHWQTQGFNLWTETEAVLPLIKNQAKYLLSSAKCFDADDFNVTSTTATSTTNDIILTDASNITESPDLILGDITESTQDWTAVNSTLSISGGLLITNTAEDGNASYALTTVVGSEYIIHGTLNKGSSSQAEVEVNDTGGVIITDSLFKDESFKLRFTARQVLTNFKITNVDVTSCTNTITALNYINVDTGSYVAVILDDLTIQWSRANFLTGSTVTLKDALNSQATLGQTVYYGDTLISRPLSLTSARYQGRPTYTEIPSLQWTRQEYFDQPDKTTQGIVSQWYYSPQLVQGELYIWGVPNSNQELLNFTYIRPVNITENNADTPDFPSEWFLPLVYGVGEILTDLYPVSPERTMSVQAKAQRYLDDALGFDNEDSYIQMSPE